MKRTSIFVFIIILVFSLKAQDEFIAPLGANTNLYYQSIPYQNYSKKEFIDNNIIITADSISLPFVDDFSKNTLKPFEFEVNISNTIEFATGTCINNEFITEAKSFQNNQSYYYYYDTITDLVDSINLSAINIYFYSSATCFPNETNITSFYPAYYRSTKSDFDTITGIKLDSTFITPDTNLDIATISFAKMPKNVNWMDNFAWWNTTNPIEPITIGVATLDGLNEFGLPYNKSVTNAYGEADVLTSKPIDLTGTGLSSDVYLSFFFQAGGLGDNPNEEDSLVVEFKGQDGVWTRKWSTAGMPSSKFKQIYVPIYENSLDSLIYSNSDFQFRFKNYASLSGNNDWWNIDYVRLDKNRIPNTLDTVIRDVSFLYDFPNYLENFSMLPWDQMQAGTDQFVDTINIPIRDNGQVEGILATHFPLDLNITNSETADTIYSELGSNYNTELQEIKDHVIFPSNNFNLPTITNTDSLLFNADMYLGASNRNSLLVNDTISNRITFNNVIAYDDGSAERAYGLSGGGSEVKKFAYEFIISTQDTLAAIQIHFSNIDENVDNLVFSLFAWDSIQLDEDYDNIIGKIDNKRPDYIDHKNGYATFVFDTPIIVKDKFYIGWAQLDNRNLQIGYDLNYTKGRNHMYLYTSNSWKKSLINMEGSVMMRAILDGDYPIPNPTSISNVSKVEYIKVYPNPTKSVLNIDVPKSLSNYSVSVYDYTGKQLRFIENEKTIVVSSFNPGVYFLKITNINRGNIYKSRFVVK